MDGIRRVGSGGSDNHRPTRQERLRPPECWAGRRVDQPANPLPLTVIDVNGAVTRQVARLRAAGFSALPLPNLAYSTADGLFLVRFGRGVVDVVTIRAFDAAAGMRVRDEFDPQNPIPMFDPNSTAERGVIWYQHGLAETVVDELLREFYPIEAGQTSRFSGSLQPELRS